MASLTQALVALAAVSTLLYVAGAVCAWWHVRRSPRRPLRDALPPLSLLKPVKGVEEDMERCLESLYTQRYPGELEVVFASADPEDPAMDVARQVASRHPQVPTRFVRTDPTWGYNPKLSNLQGALRAARHDLVLQTDANVWVAPDYLARIVTEYLDEDAALLSSLVSGVGESSPGAAMENLQLSAFTAPACCAALKLAGVPCVIGKSMLFRRSELNALGGLEPFKDCLAEDFLLGRHFMENGRKVRLSPTPVRNVNRHTPVGRHFSRHARWLKMRAVVHIPGFVADLCANPVALWGVAWLASGLDDTLGVVWLAAATAKIFSDQQLVRWVRGEPMRLRHAAMGPVKDVLMAGIWVYAIFSRSVVWRGVRLRMGADSRLAPYGPALPVRLWRRLLA